MQSQGAKTLPEKHPARPGTNPPFTVANAMFICGIGSPNIFQADSQAERISGKVFDDEFVSCMDITVK